MNRPLALTLLAASLLAFPVLGLQPVTDPAKPASKDPPAEPAKSEPTKSESPKSEPTKSEPPKTDGAAQPKPVEVIVMKSPPNEPAPDPRFRFPMDHARRLAGTWESGDADNDGKSDFRMYARNSAGFSAVTEIMFIDTEYENLSVYTSEGTDVILSFVSCLNNVPRLRAHTRGEKFKLNELDFELEPLTTGGHLNMDATGRYLKHLKIKFVDDDTVQYTVQFFVNGVDQAPGTIEFKRVPAIGMEKPLPGGMPTPAPPKAIVDPPKAPASPPK